MKPKMVFSYFSQIFITCYTDEEGKDFLSWGVVQGCFMNAQRALLTRKRRRKWRRKKRFCYGYAASLSHRGSLRSWISVHSFSLCEPWARFPSNHDSIYISLSLSISILFFLSWIEPLIEDSQSIIIIIIIIIIIFGRASIKIQPISLTKLEVFIQYCMIWEGYEKQACVIPSGMP